jgi:CRP-like cAMP-binding protein
LERNDNGVATEVRDCEAGEFMGGLTLIGETGRLFSLKSVSDTTCLVLNREKFAKTMDQFPDLLMKICKAVTHSIDNWEKRFLADQGSLCGECMVRMGVTLI